MASNFPEVIIQEILYRVPSKDLTRFKAVSKHWNSLISSGKSYFPPSGSPSQRGVILATYFITKTKNRRNFRTIDITTEKYLSIKFQESNAKVEELVLNPPFSKKIYVKGSCNGLLLLVTEYPCEMYLYNPLTCEYVTLPNILKESYLHWYEWVIFYDESIGKYIIVGRFHPTEFMKLVFGDDNWTTLTSLPYSFYNGIKSLVYIQRRLNLLSSDAWPPGCPIPATDVNWSLFSADVITWSWKKLELPRHHGCKQCYILSEVKQFVCLTSVCQDLIEIFILEGKDSEQWTKYYSVSFQSLLNLPSSVQSFLSKNVCVVAMRDIDSCDFSDLVKIFLYQRGELFCYHLKRGELKKIITSGDKEIKPLSKRPKFQTRYHSFAESLVSLY